MIELSIEEKAKRYDEAINRMKRYVIDEYGCTKIRVTDVFPELKESEDEKICGKLIAFLKQCKAVYGDGFKQFELDIDDSIAWLEAHGEQKPTEKVEPKFRVGDTMRTLQEATNGVTDGLPVIISIDNCCYHCNNETIDIKGQDDYEYPPINRRQKPTGWSEKLIADVFEMVGLAKIVREQENDALTEALQSAMIELAKYSVVPQQMQEWSEEDESHIRYLIECLEHCKKGVALTMTTSTAQEYINWLNHACREKYVLK